MDAVGRQDERSRSKIRSRSRLATMNAMDGAWRREEDARRREKSDRQMLTSALKDDLVGASGEE